MPYENILSFRPISTFDKVAVKYYLKPPKIAHNNKDPFRQQIYAEEDAKKLCKDLNLKYSNKGPSAWLYIKHHAYPHTDGYGMAGVYLYRGSGTLYVVKNNSTLDWQFQSGDVVLFNDKLEHFWLSDKPCTILTFSIIKSKGG